MYNISERSNQEFNMNILQLGSLCCYSKKFKEYLNKTPTLHAK